MICLMVMEEQFIKESNFDLINYGRIKMFIHAEPNNGDILR